MDPSVIGSYQNYSTNNLHDPAYESTRASQDFDYNNGYNGEPPPEELGPFYKRPREQIVLIFLGIVAVCGISVVYVTLTNNNFTGELKSLITNINSNIQKDQQAMNVFLSAVNNIAKTTKEQQELVKILNTATKEIVETAKEQDRAIDDLRSVVMANHALLDNLVNDGSKVQKRTMMVLLPLINIIFGLLFCT